MKYFPQHFICSDSGEVLGQNLSSSIDNILDIFPAWHPNTGDFIFQSDGLDITIHTEAYLLGSQTTYLVEAHLNQSHIETESPKAVVLQLNVFPNIDMNDPSEALIDQVMENASIGYCSNPDFIKTRITSKRIKTGQTARKALGLPFLYRLVQSALEPEGKLDLDQFIYSDAHIVDDKLQSIFCLIYESLEVEQKTHSGLLNRKQLLKQIESHVAEKEYFSLLVIDIDNFKTINNTLGHLLGDQVLTELSKRIYALSKKQKGFTAHLNSDKFAWIIPANSVKHSIETLAYRMLSELRKPLMINRIPLELDASIGIASFPKEGYSPVSLIRKAESAMLQAKSASFKVKSYQPDIELSPQQRLMVMAGIPNAISNKEFHLIFQPQVNVKNKTTKGFECLLRWSKNNKSFSPGLFIPLAEMSHHIHDLTKWIISECVNHLASWQNAGKDWTVSINFSSKNLMDSRLVNYLSSQCLKHDIPTKYVVIEVTESALMDDINKTKHLLHRLHNEGFQISIDDFGTGYSSLAYLKLLPVNMIKIDQTFVTNIHKDATDATICKSLIQMSHELGLEVVAEGVETIESMALLEELGCDYAQGYLISKGVDADRVLDYTEDEIV